VKYQVVEFKTVVDGYDQTKVPAYRNEYKELEPFECEFPIRTGEFVRGYRVIKIDYIGKFQAILTVKK